MDNDTRIDRSELPWAVVDSGSRRLIGKIELTTDGSREPFWLHMKDAVALDANVMKAPDQTGHLAVLSAPVAHFIDAEEGPVSIEVFAHSIRWFKDMKDGGDRYRRMYDMLLEMTAQQRAARAGITIVDRIPTLKR